MKTVEIPVDKLPSKGILYDFPRLILPKLTFGRVMEYSSDLSFCNNELATFLVQLRCMITDLPQAKSISMYDAVPIIAMRTFMSATPDLVKYVKLKYTCPVHNKKETIEINLSAMPFNDMNPMLKDIDCFKLDGVDYKFRIPTVDEFIAVADEFKTSLPVKDKVAIKMVWILSMFRDIMSDHETKFKILNAVRSATAENGDIGTLNLLYNELSNGLTHFVARCKNGGDAVSISIPVIEPLTAYFLDFSTRSGSDGNIFSYKERVQR